jgi:hypothetical protein
MTTMEDKTTPLLKDTTFDYAIPQSWANEVYAWTGLYPRGIVWLYDRRAPFGGRPFPVTLYGWQVMVLYFNCFVRRWATETKSIYDFIPPLTN